MTPNYNEMRAEELATQLTAARREIDQTRAALAAATQRAEQAEQHAQASEAVREVYRVLLVAARRETVRLSGRRDTTVTASAYYSMLFHLARESGALAACDQAAVEAVARVAGVPIEHESEVQP